MFLNVVNDTLAAAEQFQWSFVIVLVIGGMMLLANVLRRKIKPLRRLLMPTAVIAGFVILLVKELVFAFTPVPELIVGTGTGIRNIYDIYGAIIGTEMYSYAPTFRQVFDNTLGAIVQHTLPIAFIALILRDKQNFNQVQTKGEKKKDRVNAMKSGSILASSYLVQVILGLTITIVLGYTFMSGTVRPGLGVFAPIAYGQGAPQSFAMGGIWDTMFAENYPGLYSNPNHFRNFAVSLAATGFFFSSIVGVILINRTAKKRGLLRNKNEWQKSGDLPPLVIEGADEIPLSESIDKFTMQVCIVMGVYALTIGLIFALDVLLRLSGVEFLIGFIPTIWGFAFIIGMLVAWITKLVFKKLMAKGIMKRKYPNTFMMNRIAGVSFDFSIVSALALISVVDLGWLWIPLVLIAFASGLGTLFWLKFIIPKIFKEHQDESLVAFYGMLTGTISCGTIFLRELDPNLKTPVSQHMVSASAGAILLAVPLLLLLPIAPNADHNAFMVLGISAAYLALLTCYILSVHKKMYHAVKRRRAGAGAELVDENGVVNADGGSADNVEFNDEPIVGDEELVEPE